MKKQQQKKTNKQTTKKKQGEIADVSVFNQIRFILVRLIVTDASISRIVK